MVPVDNARYALNAANARWGSLYDAFYGTDVIEDDNGCEKATSYNPKRGEKVIEKGRMLLDQVTPLEKGNWTEVSGFSIEKGNLTIHLLDKSKTTLQNKEKFIGYKGTKEKPTIILLKIIIYI